MYGLSTLTHGSSRRRWLSSSRSRVNSFSFARNVVRAESHSSRETTGWSLTSLLTLFVMLSSFFCLFYLTQAHLRGKRRDIHFSSVFIATATCAPAVACESAAFCFAP